MLRITKLNAGYEDLTVLKDVDLTLKPGTVSVLMGPNGAGKSTLLKAIFNLVKVRSGTIQYRGQTITGLPTHTLIELGIGLVPQGRVNFGALTVRDNLMIGSYHLEDQETAVANLEQVLGMFPVLRERLSARAYTLSGGQQQLVAMARALMNLPDLLLFDEPSLGLAPKLVKEIFGYIRRVNHEFNITVLIVEHNIRSVLEVADFGYVMVGGRIEAEGAVGELRGSDFLEKVFVGKFE